jgi:hypothetical protein
MPLWQSGFMDLGFARRSLARRGAVDPAFDYRMLLASVSARQAISPTAQAQAALGRGGITDFVSGEGSGACKLHSASFHAVVASAIAADCKSL